jgi:myo-inositol-1(or 4)-monophosphatase
MPLAVVDPESLGQCLVATGFGYDPERRAVQGRAIAQLLPQVRDIRRFGAASLDLCAVAAGRVDAYVEQGLKPWDRAAGALIATEAGALVTGLDGGPADERMIIACAPRLHPELARVVRACGF